MVAWTAHLQSEAFINSKKWAAYPQHLDGSLWALFAAGFVAGHAGPAAPSEPQPEAATPALSVPPDFITHRDAWRDAIVEAINAASIITTINHTADYWRRELDAFDRAFDELLAVAPAAAQPAPVKEAAGTDDVGRELPHGWWDVLNELRNNTETFGEYSQETARVAIESCMNALEAFEKERTASPAQAKQEPDLRQVLREVRDALQFANDTPNGAIQDTIWMMHRPETLFDFIDAALGDVPAEDVAGSADTASLPGMWEDADLIGGETDMPLPPAQAVPKPEDIAEVIMHLSANGLLHWRGTGDDEDDAWSEVEERRVTISEVIKATNALAARKVAQATPVGGQEMPELPGAFGQIDVYHDDGSVTAVNGYTADQVRGYALDYATQQLRAALAASQQAAHAVTVDRIRSEGWAVAVHNDYRLNGDAHTFWLFTKNGLAVKGEGKTDAEALAQVDAAIRALKDASPADQGAREVEIKEGFFSGCKVQIDPSLPPDTVEMRGANTVRLNMTTGEVTEVSATEPMPGLMALPDGSAELRRGLKEIKLCYPWGNDPKVLLRVPDKRDWYIKDAGENVYLPEWQNNLVNSAIAAAGGYWGQHIAAMQAKMDAGRLSEDQIAAYVGATLAKYDGLTEDDMSQLKWSGGAVPEPEGDRFSLEYWPLGLAVAKALAKDGFAVIDAAIATPSTSEGEKP
jgi:hypothetical protein